MCVPTESTIKNDQFVYFNVGTNNQLRVGICPGGTHGTIE